MFRAFELGTFLVKATLGHTSVSYMKPYMVTLVFSMNSFTKFRVCLNKPPIVLVSLNLLDPRTLLTFEILLNEIFKGLYICKSLRETSLLLFRTNRK